MAASAAGGRLGGLVNGRLRQPHAAILAAFLQLLPRASASSSSAPAVFPYTPTTILVPSTNASVVYIFSPTTDGQVEFLALNISSTVSTLPTDNITTLTQGVPFLANDGHQSTETAFVPSLRSDGSIAVIEGACSSSESASLWTYTPANVTAETADWTNSTLSLSSSQTGPWFLGGSISFSNEVAPTVSNSTVYMYGGMCPTNTSTSSGNWQSHASYSNKMLKVVPGTDEYTVSTVSSKGPPVAEAGFSFTTLPASVSNRSGIVTQEVSTVVLGGHTQKAFVNMSTAALWSLPEEAWSFVTIANPSTSSSIGTELAVVRRSESPPDSRSGHTAVLSEDGNSIVVLGGWVGDVGQAADPQLAVLEMGSGYDDWQWTIPDAQPAGSGIYGHGAALLPGNVMLVYGGYNISSSTASAKRVRRDSASDSGLLFYNLTSQSWLEAYTNPNSIDTENSDTAPPSKQTLTSSSKIGYGVGLGLGIPLLILVLALIIRSWRRHRRRAKRREGTVAAIDRDLQNQHFLNNHDEMIDTGNASLFHGPPQDPLGSYTGGHDAYTLGRQSLGVASMRGGEAGAAFPSYESPKMGAEAEDSGTFTTLRKPSRNVARGLYQPTTINDYDAMMSGGAGPGGAAPTNNATKGIHPIYEDEEEEEEEDRAATRPGIKRRSTVYNAADVSEGRSATPEEAESLVDPFSTPTSDTMAAGSSPLRSTYAGALVPNTVNLNPFVRSTPSPEAITLPQPLPVAGKGGATTTVGQDRDVQEWVSGLEIEDLLFAPPAPGVVAASSTPVPQGQGLVRSGTTGTSGTARGRSSPTNAGRRASVVSKTSQSGSPTRISFLGRAAKDDEARTGSNLSDKSALTFLSRTTSLHSRLGTGHSGATDAKATNGESSTASFNTAATGFHGLRAEGPSLLYGRSHQNESSAGGSSGGASAQSSSIAGSVTGSVHTGASSPVQYSLRAPPAVQPQAPAPSPFEYGGAAAVLAGGGAIASSAGRTLGHRRAATLDESNERTALTGGIPGTPSKSKPRRTWMGNLMRIFSSTNAPTDAQGALADDAEALDSSVGTGAQQEPNYQNMAHATLLRRKQGRSDWEADEWREEESTAVGAIRSGGRTASLSSVSGFGRGASLTQAHARAHGHTRSASHGTAVAGLGVTAGLGGPATAGVAATGRVADGHREGSGKSDDWDVEKAVQNRVVQVMFTMPRDQLRVVNAEVEDEDDGDLSSVHTAAPGPGGGEADDGDTLSVKKLRRADKGKEAEPEPTRPERRSVSANHMDMDEDEAKIMQRQEEHMRLMQDALAESKRLLSGQHLEPWADDRDPRTKGELADDVEVPRALSRATPDQPGQPGSRSSTPPRAYRKAIPEEEFSLATAAALARTLMAAAAARPVKVTEHKRPVDGATDAAAAVARPAKAAEHTRSVDGATNTAAAAPRVPIGSWRTAVPGESALSPSARAIPTRPSSPVKTAIPAKTVKTVKSVKSMKTLSLPAKVPSRERSADSLATAASRQSASSSKSGYVASIVDRIETSSPRM